VCSARPVPHLRQQVECICVQRDSLLVTYEHHAVLHHLLVKRPAGHTTAFVGCYCQTRQAVKNPNNPSLGLSMGVPRTLRRTLAPKTNRGVSQDISSKGALTRQAQINSATVTVPEQPASYRDSNRPYNTLIMYDLPMYSQCWRTQPLTLLLLGHSCTAAPAAVQADIQLPAVSCLSAPHTYTHKHTPACCLT
jgi:hypothetical protein